MALIEEFIFYDVTKKALMSAKFLLYILEVYIMGYIITKFRDSNFSRSEIKVCEAPLPSSF